MPSSALLRSLPLAIVLAAVSFASARATVVFGNLGDDGSGGLAGFFFSGTSPARSAQGMTTGTTLLSIDSIKLGLDRASSGTGNYAVSIFNSVSGFPGTAVATTNSVSIAQTGSGSIYEFTFATPVTLQPSTTYWIVPPTDLYWYANGSDNLPGGQNGSGYTFFKSADNLDGTAWLYDGFGGTPWAVSVSAVPEPGTAVLVLAGLAAAYVCRRACGRRPRNEQAVMPEQAA